MFQSYQFMQINPDFCKSGLENLISNRFQSYQFMQINPDEGNLNLLHKLQDEGFNRINSCRSIPTWFQRNHIQMCWIRFQSYQFMQINPDQMLYVWVFSTKKSFNRINSCRSIPTAHAFGDTFILTGVSIVSIHADQSRLRRCQTSLDPTSRFNRINSCRSIPTRRHFWWRTKA